MTITRTDTNRTYDPQGNLLSSVDVVVDITAEANAAAIDAKLAQLYTDAATAQTNIANLLAQASPAAGTLTTAQLSNAVRQLDTALRQVANIESNVIQRLVAVVKRIRGDLQDVTGT